MLKSAGEKERFAVLEMEGILQGYSVNCRAVVQNAYYSLFRCLGLRTCRGLNVNYHRRTSFLGGWAGGLVISHFSMETTL
jgi:hypothetical protein